jgi:hypothetical protein
MRKLRVLGAAALGLTVLAGSAMAQRGGAVRSGVRGAAIGGMVGGEEGAATGAKVGAVTGATRAAVDREAQARVQYQTTAAYQAAPHSNFQEAPPDVLGTTAPGAAAPPSSGTKPGGEVVISKDGKPVLGVTFPSDWKQTTGESSVSAISKDGQACAMFGTMAAVADKPSGIKNIKAGLEGYLHDVKYDEPIETKGGTLVITGTGKTKKNDVEVVFVAAVFDSGKGQFGGAAFVVDAKIEDHYKATVRGICETLRRADDFAKN